MERAELKLIAAGFLVGIAAGFLAARAVYVGNAPPSQGPVVMGPAAPGAAPPGPEEAMPAMSPEEEALHGEVNVLLARVRANPDDREANVALADLTFDSGLYDIAAKFYEEALRIRSDDAVVLTDLGIAYRNLERADEAVALLEKAVAVDPGHATAWFDLAVLRFEGRRDLAGAKAAVEKVLVLDAAYPEAAKLKRRVEEESAS